MLQPARRAASQLLRLHGPGGPISPQGAGRQLASRFYGDKGGKDGSDKEDGPDKSTFLSRIWCVDVQHPSSYPTPRFGKASDRTCSSSAKRQSSAMRRLLCVSQPALVEWCGVTAVISGACIAPALPPSSLL